MNASEKDAAYRAAHGITVPEIEPKPRPDFAKLRAERDAALSSVIDRVAQEWVTTPDKLHVHVSPHGCYCACASGGPCEHEWGGWRESDDGLQGEQFCKYCGMGAMAHSLRYSP